jgi:hypothetical protein
LSRINRFRSLAATTKFIEWLIINLLIEAIQCYYFVIYILIPDVAFCSF